MSLVDRLPIKIVKNSAPKAPAAPLVVQATNSFEDSAAATLQRRSPGARVTANGRELGDIYDNERIRELYVGYIFAAIRKVSNKAAEVLSEKLKTVDENGEELADGANPHPYIEILNSSPGATNKFFQGIATYYVVLGEAFVFTGERVMQAGNYNMPSVFELLQSNEITRTYNEDGDEDILASYKRTYKRKNGMPTEKLYLPGNVIEITDFNPWDMSKGYGQMRPVLSLISLEVQATRLQSATIANTIKAPGIIGTVEEVKPDEFEDFEKRVNDRWTSNDMDKAGTPIVVNGSAVDYKPIETDWDKLAMQKIRELNRDAFFAALGVSKTILGIEQSGTTRETSRVQTEQFILDHVMPIANAIMAAFNQDYITNYSRLYSQRKVKLDADAPIEKDLETEKAEAEIGFNRAQTFKNYIQSGVEPQQAAELSGIELPKGKSIIMREIPAVIPDDPTPAPTPSGNSHTHNHQSPKQYVATKNAALPDAQKKKIESAKKTLLKSVTRLDGKLGNLFVKQVNTVDHSEQTEYIEKLAEILFAYYLVALPIYGNDNAIKQAATHGLTSTQFIVNATVKEIVMQRLTKVANEHFATVSKKLSQIINQGVRDNINRDVIIKQVQAAVSNEVETYMVERLVDTESGNAYRQATYLSDKHFIDSNGFTGRAYKRWRINSGNPCVFCKAKAAQGWIAFEDNFANVGDTVEAIETLKDGGTRQVAYKVGFTDVNAGGLHPNCECDYELEIRP